MKINLGCGKDKMNGYINCDISPKVNPDMIINLEEHLPFKDNSIDEIIIYHTLEHIKNFSELINELIRISKAGTKIKVKVPFYLSYSQFTDPTHRRFFTPYTFDYFSKDSELGTEYKDSKYNIGTLKVECKIKYMFKDNIITKIINPIINFNQRVYCKLFAGIFPASELEYELEVVKPFTKEP